MQRDDYAVGYGRPPVRTRFRKGQSGNPSGRPRAVLDLAELAAKALTKPVGSAARRTNREAIVARIVDGAAQADFRATRLLLDILQGGLPAPPAVSSEEGDRARDFLICEFDRLADEHEKQQAAERAERELMHGDGEGI